MAKESVVLTGKDVLALWDWAAGDELIATFAGGHWRLPLDSRRAPMRMVLPPGEKLYLQVSPDGRWLAYSGAVGDDVSQVFVQSFPPSQARWAISSDGGSMPRWRGDGRALFYRGADGRLREVGVTASGTADSPRFAYRELAVTGVSVPLSGNNDYFTYHPSFDGTRFLVNVPVNTAAPTTVVLNWQAALRH